MRDRKVGKQARRGVDVNATSGRASERQCDSILIFCRRAVNNWFLSPVLTPQIADLIHVHRRELSGSKDLLVIAAVRAKEQEHDRARTTIRDEPGAERKTARRKCSKASAPILDIIRKNAVHASLKAADAPRQCRMTLRLRYLTLKLRALCWVCGVCAPGGAFLGPRGGEFAAKNEQSCYCENDY